MKFHIYGQKGMVELPADATVQDLRSLAHFNRIIRNYLSLQKKAGRQQRRKKTILKKNEQD